MRDTAKGDYLPDSPYPGIEPFSYAHRNVFFAREIEARTLIRLIVMYRGVLLYSDSGTGKSSLVNAGLIPLAIDEGYQPQRIRVQPKKGEEIIVERLSEKADGEPPFLPSLFALDGKQERIVLSVEKFLETLRQMARAVHPLLIFEQFEEWITLFEQDSKGQVPAESRATKERILNALVELVNDSELPVKVLIVLREDYLAKLTPLFERCPNLPDQYLRLMPLKGDQIYRVIRGPFEERPGRYRPEVSPSLAREIQAQFEGRSWGADIRLTEVQIVCQSLFETRRQGPELDQVFTDQGGVQGILERYLERALESLEVEQQEPAVDLLTQMVTSAGTRKRISREDLLKQVASEDKIPSELLSITLDSLEKRTKLVRRERLREVHYYEIASEFLLGWIRKKAQERQRLAEQRKLEEAQRAAQEQRQRAEKEARNARILLVLTISLVVMLMIAGWAIFTAFQQRSVAVEQGNARAKAEAQAIIDRDAARQAQATAVAAEAEAVAQRDIATSRQLAAQARAHLDDQLDLALLLSLEANRITDTVEARSSLLAGLGFSPHLTIFLRGHTNWVRNLAFSPDGQTLASGSADGTIILWDAATGQPIGQPLTGHTAEVRSVAFSPDGQTLASGSADQTIILWDVTTGQSIGQPLTGHDFDVNSVAFSPDGQTLASGSRDNTVILWDDTTGQPIGQPLTGHTAEVWSVAFSPDGQTLASGSANGTIILWDVTTGQPIGKPLTEHDFDVFSVAFSPDGQTLASGSRDLAIILWDVATGQPIGQPLTGHSDSVFSVAFSPDGQTLASGSRDFTIILWDVATGQPIGQPFTGHSGWVNSVAFSPDGQALASGSVDQTIILWDVTARQRLGQPLTGHTDWARSVAFSPDGRTLASGSRDLTIILWNVTTGQPTGQPLTGHVNWVNSVAFSPDGQTLASGSQDNTIVLWDVTAGQPIGQPLTGHTDRVHSVAFSPDGQTLASASEDNTIILWDVATSQRLDQPLTGHTDAVRSAAFSPDGRTLASGSEDKTIILWDVEARQPLGQPLTGHTKGVLSVAFSPDGQTLASASYRTIILWDAATGQPLGPSLTGHTDWVHSVAFSPDGQTLVSGGEDNTIILWDVEARQPLDPPLIGHTDAVLSVAFSPDGQTLASGSRDNTVILWDVSFESWQARACRIANRNLTQVEWNQFIGPEILYERTCSAPCPAPALISPDEGKSFPERQDVKLMWEWEQDLAGNEFFEVRIRLKGEQKFDSMDLTKVPYQFVPASKLTQAGTYEWQVAIVLLSGEEKGASQIWSFEVQ
jgi:WD40 repeat protein